MSNTPEYNCNILLYLHFAKQARNQNIAYNFTITKMICIAPLQAKHTLTKTQPQAHARLPTQTYLEKQKHSNSNHDTNGQAQTEDTKTQTYHAKLHSCQMKLICINIPGTKQI